MRPRKLDPYYDDVLVMMFNKVKGDLEGRSNQFQVASKLISYFPDFYFSRHITSFEEEKRQQAFWASVESYFELDYGDVQGVAYYLGQATPAAVVQMIKRIRFRYKTQ